MAKRPPMTAFKSALSAAEARPHDAEPQPSQTAGARPTRAIKATSAPTVPLPPKRRKAEAADKAAVFIRVTPESLAAVRALAEAEGLTVQDLGVYALNLALAQYGREPAVKGAGGRG